MSEITLKTSEFANYLLQQRIPENVQENWLQNFQADCSDRLTSIPFPTLRQESWKYTDVSSLLRPWQLAKEVELASEDLKNLISAHTLLEAEKSLVVFINGRFAPEFSNIQNLPKEVSLSYDSTIPSIQTQLATGRDSLDFFATLNSACFQELAVIQIPANIQLDAPIQILFVQSSSEIAIAHNRFLVLVGENSKVNLVQTHIGTDNQPYFANSVTQIWLEANAQLDHTFLQQQGSQAFDLTFSQVFQAAESSYRTSTISLGAKLARHTLQIQQQGAGANTEVNGLVMINDSQLADTHSVISHNFANGTSQQLHKCVIGDRAHAVFSGKIQVAKAAQLTNSSQFNRNLLRSSQAKIDTQPQLEILADNVKCAHGATVSQLDQEEIFYLQSRGIDLDKAVNFLTYGFVAEVIIKIPIVSLRERLNQFVLEQI
jgi:Fe-S cluster assembly protein SufD